MIISSYYFLRYFYIINLLFSIIVVNSQSIEIISWNIQDFGQTKDDSEISTIANIIKEGDLIAIQEVVAGHPGGAQAVGRLVDQLNRIGAHWDYRISDPTNCPIAGQVERYAFIWKTSRIEMLYKPFLDTLLALQCIREPFIGHFRLKTSKKEFILVNFHSRRFDQHPEIEIKLFYKYPLRFDVPVIIAGDFNVSEDNIVFQGLYEQEYIPTVLHQKTTLKQVCNNGQYLNHAIDNVYIPPDVCFQYGEVIDFIKSCQSLESARMISDHLPVFSRLSF